MTDFTDLIDGYHRFRDDRLARASANAGRELSDGQAPKVMVIACSDSRVDPAHDLRRRRPGEIFVVRNVANLVPPFETGGGRHGVSAALEFAVTQLEVERDRRAGPRRVRRRARGADAAASRARRRARAASSRTGSTCSTRRATGSWRNMATGRRRCARWNWRRCASRIANLRTFPCIPEREAAGTLQLHGAYFAIADGRIARDGRRR